MVNTPELDKILKGGNTLQPTMGGSLNTPELDNILKGTMPDISTSGTTQVAKKESKAMTGWKWVSKQLMKPVGAVAAEAEALGTLIGTGQSTLPGQAAFAVLSGKREYSFGQLWSEHGKEMGISPKVSSSIGFVTDIAADPLWFVGGGLTKAGKLATKASSLSKAGKTIAPTSKLGRTIAKSGYTTEQLVLAGTKLEQAEKGQRALITALGKPIISGTKYYKATERLSGIVKASKIGAGLRQTFTTKTGIKYLDEAVDNFKNLAEYRKQQVVDKAIEIQNGIKKMPKEDIKAIAEVIERPEIAINIKNKAITKIANQIEGLFDVMKKTEKSKGVLKSELDKYFPHIKAKEALGDRIKHFFSPSVYNATLGAASKRTVGKFVSETGKELIGQAKKVGLKPSEWVDKNPISKTFNEVLKEWKPGASPIKWIDKKGLQFKFQGGTISEINARFGKEFFESNPVLAYAQRGLASTKSVTAKEFLDDVGKKFFVNAEKAPLRFTDSTNPLFKGLRAEPEVVKAVDQYIQGIQPEDLKLIIRGFDRVQNWWKAEVLISPSYHMRNMISNFWNNWLAGVSNPVRYKQAGDLQLGKKAQTFITEAGEKISGKTMVKEAEKRGVLGRGWYGADIAEKIQAQVGGISKLKKLLPWEQENYLFKANRKVGETIENNARLSHFIDKVAKGYSFDDAARSVKTFLFDYADLTPTERNVFKRLFPFYTWSKKNLPLQLENMVSQPAKYSAIPKVIERIESGVANPKDEKYMSSYISDNVPVKIRTNEEGNTEYFLMGNWLPAAQAIDLLSNPLENIINMVTPLAKTPMELWANKSLFFKNTLGEPSNIEFYYKQPTEFVGVNMRKKAAHLLRNIRVLNDIDKLVKTPAKDEPENSNWVKLLNVLFGKAATYDIKTSRYFYQRDTEQRITELKSSIKKAQRVGDKEKVKKLVEELKEFKKER